MKKLFMSVALLILVVTSFAQTPGYEFTTVVSHQATPVKDQGSTGTCWCFATASFMESELLRMGKGEYKYLGNVYRPPKVHESDGGQLSPSW